VGFAAASEAPAATAAREELGGEAGTAAAPWVTGMGRRPWPGRLVLGRLAAAAEGGGVGCCGGSTAMLRPHGAELFNIHRLRGVHGGSGSHGIAMGRLGSG